MELHCELALSHPGEGPVWQIDPSNSDSLIFYPLKIKQKCQCVLWDSVALLQKKKKKRDGYLLVRDMELYGQEK